MKVLVIGGSGFLGLKINETLEKNNFEPYATYNDSIVKGDNYFHLDITKKMNVYHLLEKTCPDVVIQTAAFVNVEECEIKRKKASDVNIKGTRNVACAVKKIDAKLVYISTDCVFDGKKGMYREDDKPNPINYYGVTKLGGERVVDELLDEYIIARTAVIYGSMKRKRGFAAFVFDQLEAGNKIEAVTDIFNNPTYIIDLAEILIKLIQYDKTGIFHVSGSERINRYNFAIKIAELFDFDRGLVEPITSEEIGWVAKRPKDASFDVSKISKIKRPFDIKDGLIEMKKKIK